MSEQCIMLIDEIIQLRKERKMSQKDLSEACGLTQSVIARIESKKSTPTITTLYKIITALDARLTITK